jgi:hypothetical protein
MLGPGCVPAATFVDIAKNWGSDVRHVYRLAVLIAGVTGLLALLGSAAQAIHVVGNHCEPTRRAEGRHGS